MKSPNTEIMYSVVVPVFNENEVLPEIIKKIEQALEHHLGSTYEIIFVNDGSNDNSWQIIQENNRRNPNIKGVSFSRNFGHQTAIIAGLKICQGEMVAIMDADGQDSPELLPELFRKSAQGFDVVYAIRKRRKENFLKKAAYFAFYRILNRLSEFEIPVDSGDFSVINRKVVNSLISFKEHNPFIRGLRYWGGGKFIGIEYDRQARIKGKSKYNLMKLIKLAITGFVSFSKVPLRISTFLGIFISLISFSFGVINILRYIMLDTPFSGFATLVVIITFLGGIQLVILGVIGEYIGFIFDEIKGRPLFSINDTIGIDDKLTKILSQTDHGS